MKSFIFNPGDESYRIDLDSKYYVDKTDLIYYLNGLINTEDRFISVSRPRRFGKTVTVNMLTAYYSYSEKKTTIFNDKNIGAIYDEQNKNYKYLNEFNVINLVMNEYFANCSVEEGIKKMVNKIIKEIETSIKGIEFPKVESIVDIFETLYNKTGRKIVFIVDEWDYVLRHFNDETSAYKYLEFLNTFLKDKENIALAYITGILPLKKNKEQSSLNNFIDFSMVLPSWTAKYFGFTDDEVKELCEIHKQIEIENSNYEIDEIIKKRKKNNGKITITRTDNKEIRNTKEKKKVEICYNDLKNWYNGYELADRNHRVYNIYSPYSIVNAFQLGYIKNYWINSVSSSLLKDYVKLNYGGLKEDIVILMKRNRIKININTYQNDMSLFENKDDVLTMLIHLGYLGYDIEKSEVFIPNKEILGDYENCTKSSNWSVLFKIYQQSKTLLQETWKCNKEKVASLIEDAHGTVDNKTYNSEAALKYAILFAYYAANEYYTIIPEMYSGKRYTYVYFIPVNKIHPALVVELKYNKTAETVISQIKQKNYPQRLIHYKENLILVGINYDRTVKNNVVEFKHHSCEIEKHKF